MIKALRMLFLVLPLAACGGQPGQSTQAFVIEPQQGGETSEPPAPVGAQPEVGGSGTDGSSGAVVTPPAPSGGVGGLVTGGAPASAAGMAGTAMVGAGGANGGSGGETMTLGGTGGNGGTALNKPSCVSETERESPDVSYVSKQVMGSWNPNTRCWDYLDAWFFTKDGIDSIAPECWFPRKLCLQ